MNRLFCLILEFLICLATALVILFYPDSSLIKILAALGCFLIIKKIKEIEE